MCVYRLNIFCVRCYLLLDFLLFCKVLEHAASYCQWTLLIHELGIQLVTATGYSVIAQTVTHSNTNSVRIKEYMCRKYINNVQYKKYRNARYVLEKALKI